ncbi:MAG: ChaN family lipoprotein [Thermodesulfobacteriota bacterium]|nr:ChaN family lipoprotein [Thermodesulfobacteriota bacterium]
MNTVLTFRFSLLSTTFRGVLILTCLYSSLSLAGTPSYHLDISFQPDQHSLQAKATVSFPPGKDWLLYTGGLNIQEITLQEKGKNPFPMPLPQNDTIQMYGSSHSQQVTISYSLTVPPRAGDNLISTDGIVLTGGWHPLPQQNMIFSLNAVLPQGFSGISESDKLPEQSKNGRMSTTFSQEVRSIHFAAGPYQVKKESVRDGLSISTWFFAEDQQLSREYLDAAKTYILRHEKEIGPFPYKHYAIVSNRLPSGFGMPTFTLLGQMVLRLPFIKETSLGHEILHSWFGNSIEVADNSGNWCEGLTSYLADYSYAADKGKGTAHRKAGLINYQNYVNPNSAFPLQNFRSASHNQPMAKAKRAVGYNRAAMLFHQLRGLLGPEDFTQGLRLFVSTWQGRAATWMDIQTVFETVSKKDLKTFFIQQLTRNDTPSLEISNVRIEGRQDKTILHIQLQQNTEQAYALRVPIRVTTLAGEQNFIREITEKETDISITLSDPPLSFAVDPDYDLFRTLTSSEHPPVWSGFSGAENKLLILETGKTSSALAPFVEWAKQQGWTVIKNKSVSNQQLSENSILFLGADSAAYRSLFGKSPVVEEGFHVSVKTNPLNNKEVAVLLASNSAEETKAALHKLKHYGKYSSLSFKKGRIQKKNITPSDTGIEYQLENLPDGGATAAINNFEQIITKLAENRVIYLGETHDSMADHLLQLRIIQSLQKQGLDLAIAMEMFPVSSQRALDNYLIKQKKMDEAEFLRASHWFKVWRYDWRLFRPIFNFCRLKKIPVYGINVEKDIVSSVFSSGNTDELSKKQIKTIAPDRDLSLDGYVERLRIVHGFHADSPHGKGKGISGFVQSQAIWDESMAENIAHILQKNPDKTVVVIAGSQHTRKDSGIPPRLLRRMDVKQASVLNLYADNSPANPETQADFFFLAEPVFLKAKGKIGIILATEKDDDEKEYLRITGLSHAGKAKEAGILENDIIISINEHPAKNMEDIGILMMDSRAGDILLVKVLRTDENGDTLEKEISVELSDMTKPPMHP